MSKVLADFTHILQDYIIYENALYTQVYETNTGGLRSIYPSLEMRHLFGDVTMGQWHYN